MSDIITGIVPVSNFYPFPTVETATSTYNPSLRPKNWAAPAGYDFAAHGFKVIAGLVIFPVGVQASAVGNLSLVEFYVPLAEVYNLNIVPASKMPGVAVKALEPYPVPLDPLRWDAEHYHLTGNGPLDSSHGVRDDRAPSTLPTTFNQGDRAAIMEILAAVTAMKKGD